MKTILTRILPAALAATVALTGVAAAQPHGHAYGHDKWEKQQRKADRKWEKQQRKAERRADRAWRRGEYLPPEYRSSAYRLDDYRQYGLQAPPRGYEYYRQGNNVLLTAISSGLIQSVLSSVLGGGLGQVLQGQSYGYGQPSYGYQQPYGYDQPVIRGYDRYGRPIY